MRICRIFTLTKLIRLCFIDLIQNIFIILFFLDILLILILKN